MKSRCLPPPASGCRPSGRGGQGGACFCEQAVGCSVRPGTQNRKAILVLSREPLWIAFQRHHLQRATRLGLLPFVFPGKADVDAYLQSEAWVGAVTCSHPHNQQLCEMLLRMSDQHLEMTAHTHRTSSRYSGRAPEEWGWRRFVPWKHIPGVLCHALLPDI